MAECTHLDSVEFLDAPDEVAGCEECLELGMSWVHLRMCQQCGHIGCCDNSVGKHATAHFKSPDHPVGRTRRDLELVLRRRPDVRAEGLMA
jgi:uncharacterized UBP type Zn finger protein